MNRMERQRQCNVCYENVIRKEKELGQFARNEIALAEFTSAGIDYGQKNCIWMLRQFVKDLYKDLEINSEQTWLANEIITKFENLHLRKMGEKFK